MTFLGANRLKISMIMILGGMTMMLDCTPIMIPVKLILKLPSHIIFLDPGASPTPKNMAFVNMVKKINARHAERRRTRVNELCFGLRKMENQI